jgi:hypothetical protein
MGSIPLVALAGGRPRVGVGSLTAVDPVEGYNAAVQNDQKLALGAQDVATGQQKLEEGQMSLEMKRQAMKDQQTVMQALAQHDGDVEKALPALAGKVLPQTFQGLLKFHLETKKDLAEIDDKELKTRQDAHDRTTQLFDYATKLPDDQYAAQWPTIAQKNNELNPQHPLDPNQPVPKDKLPGVAVGLQTQEQYLAQEKARREQATAATEQEKNTAQAEKDRAEAAKARMEVSGGAMTGAMADSKYRNILMQEQLGRPVSPEDKAFKVAYQKQKEVVPQFNFNLQANGVQGSQKATTDASGQPLSYDQQIKNFGPKGGLVKAIIEGRQDPPASFAQKSPYWQDVMQKVYQVDPEFNQQRAQLRKAYTVGQQSKEINAINTAMGHVGVLGDAIDALHNSDVKLLNSIANKLGVQIGKDNVTTFNTIVHRVGPELSKAYIGAGGSAGERGTDEKDFDPSLGEDQLRSNVGITAQLLRSKIGALENQWDQNRAPSMKSFSQQFISPEAQKQLDRYSPGGKSAGASAGKKVLPLAAIQKAAKDHGVSVDEAKRQAEAAGYTIQ